MKIDYKILNKLIGTKIDAPQYATKGSSAMDLRVCSNKNIMLHPGQTLLIDTGIAIHIKDLNTTAMILPRSGLGHKQGIVLGNGTGLIDSDYQGELKISAHNRSDTAYLIEPGERLAQLVLVKIEQADLNLVEEFGESSERGEGGFGSSGKDKIKLKTEENEIKSFKLELAKLTKRVAKLESTSNKKVVTNKPSVLASAKVAK